jgi:LmbE family N-acetylglucosaminyl deacetylase
MRRIIQLVFISYLLIATIAFGSVTPSIPDAAHLQIALNKLRVVGGALYIGAHPDDENTAVLSYLSQGKLVRAAYLSLTRGEGGQNLIGSEQGDLLGIIRTQELLAARDFDHAEQFFTRAVDFGYSKNPEETLRIWGKDKILADVVWVIRKFRPDVIICRFPTDGRGGHGNHTASAILAQEAFTAAADKTRFPEQLQYVAPWQATRIVWNTFRWSAPPSAEEAANMVKLDVGEYNPVLGLSYSELAGKGRSMHKSQGFGDSEDRGPLVIYFQTMAGTPTKTDLFEGIDLSWKRIPGSEKIDAALAEAVRAYRIDNPPASLPALIKAYSLMQAIPKNPWIEEKKQETLAVIRGCAGLWLEAIATQDSGVPGSSVTVNLAAINRSTFPLTAESVAIGSNTVEMHSELKNNIPAMKQPSITIPDSMPYSQPYWLNGKIEQTDAGKAENDPAVVAKWRISSGAQTLEFDVPVLYRVVDPVRGEIYQRFNIVPPIALNLKEKVTMFAEHAAKDVRVELRSEAANVSGTVRLSPQDSWTVEPASIPFNFDQRGMTSTVTFHVSPSWSSHSAIYKVEATVGGKTIDRGLITIQYPHIPPQTILPMAQGKLVLLNLKKTGVRIAYIMGSGDAIPDALRQIGYDVTLFTPAQIAGADLSGFQAVIAGVRLYNTHSEMKSVQPKLLEYVKNGGTFVVQYNTTDDLVQMELGPYPFRISHDRVTVEESPVDFIKPDHPMLHFPNEITKDDFNGWIQERGLYFPDQWDSQYQTVIACNDPGETSKQGGILYAKYGKGIYIYTGYSFFRELPAGVAGAYRLFVNMISAKQ